MHVYPRYCMTSWLDGIVVQQQMRGVKSHLRLQTTIAVEEVGMVVVETGVFRVEAGVFQKEVIGYLMTSVLDLQMGMMEGEPDVSLLLLQTELFQEEAVEGQPNVGLLQAGMLLMVMVEGQPGVGLLLQKQLFQMQMVEGQPDVSLLLQARMGGVRGVAKKEETRLGHVDEVDVRRTGMDRRKVRFLVGAIGDGNLEKEVVMVGNGKMKVQQQAGVVGNVQQ